MKNAFCNNKLQAQLQNLRTHCGNLSEALTTRCQVCWEVNWLVGSLVSWLVGSLIRLLNSNTEVANTHVNGYISNLKKYRYDKQMLIYKMDLNVYLNNLLFCRDRILMSDQGLEDLMEQFKTFGNTSEIINPVVLSVITMYCKTFLRI